MISTERLYPHPRNPRQDVGDISELVDSIKRNGIYQNLTVIKGGAGVPEGADGYTVIIGHRRLAASKAAGLTELPCSVVEMSDKQQAATMLLENMQRSDLTVYEQAQGFQTMLDLGATEAEISEQTGFSKATVKHRLKLLELDPEEFRKAEERCPSMQDYIKLEKLTDPKLKSKALSSIGTNNFDWTYESCLRHQREKTIAEEWLAYLDSLFVKEAYDPNREFVKTVNMVRKITEEDKAELDALEEADENCDLSYSYEDGKLYAYIMGKKLDKPKPKYEDEQRIRSERIERARKVSDQAQTLRRAFVRSYASKKRNVTLLLRAMFCEEVDLTDVSWSAIAEELKISSPLDEEGEEEGFTAEELTENSDFILAVVDTPDKVLLVILSEFVESYNVRPYDWNGYYEKNEHLEWWYNILAELGYSMSDDEKALLDGTHECFKEEEK